MSDQLFVGTAPTSPAGKEIFFYSHEDWLAVATCILNNLTDEFPLYPKMDSGSAIDLANDLKELLENGICQNFYEWYASNSCSAETQEEALALVDHYMQTTRQFVVFLDACGGCTPAPT